MDNDLRCASVDRGRQSRAQAGQKSPRDPLSPGPRRTIRGSWAGGGSEQITVTRLGCKPGQPKQGWNTPQESPLYAESESGHYLGRMAFSSSRGCMGRTSDKSESLKTVRRLASSMSGRTACRAGTTLRAALRSICWFPHEVAPQAGFPPSVQGTKNFLPGTWNGPFWGSP